MSKKKKNRSNRPATNTNIPKSGNNPEAAKNNVPRETAAEENAAPAEEKPAEEKVLVEEVSDNKTDLTEEKTSEDKVAVDNNAEEKNDLTEDKTSEDKAAVDNNAEEKNDLTEDKTSEDKVAVDNNAENNKTEKVRNAEKLKSVKRQRFYFAFAIAVFLFAAIGVVSTVVLAVNAIRSSISDDPLKEEFTKFLLPVAGNDVAPFENYGELSNYSKINCSIWNILLNHDTSVYNLSETGEFIISEYDVEFSCKEIFGSSENIVHRTVGATDMSFVYDSDKHVYSCRKDLRYLNYVPEIKEMSESGGRYTLTVEYYLPAMLFLSENMGLETDAEKTMKYIIDRNDGKNTLVAVQFTSEDIY